MTDPRIAIIGDSLTHMGGNGETFIRSALADAGIPDGSLYFYGVIGKRTTAADSEGKTTAQNIADARTQLGQVDQWIIALGTNDRNSEVPYVRTTIQTVLSTIGSEPVIWIGLSSKGAATPADIATNGVIQEELRPGDTYADWDTHIRAIDGGADPSPYWNTGDSTHMPPLGYQERAKFYVQHLEYSNSQAAYVGATPVTAAFLGSKRVNLGGAPAGNNLSPISAGSTWAYYYETAAPPTGWKDISFDDSSWSAGPAPLGWSPAGGIATPIESTGTNPLAVYFRRSFEVVDATQVASLTINTRADDGVVVYVNGVEVGRDNMPAGAVGHGTYASAAPSYFAEVTYTAPGSLIVAGENVIAAQTHLNYTSTPSVTFELAANITAGE